MRHLPFILLLFFCCSANAQNLKKYPIGNTGCAASFYCNPGKFDINYSEDSSKMYTGECQDKDVTYGVICVKLKKNIVDLQMAETMLIQYMDFLKQSLNTTEAMDYTKGLKIKNNPKTTGISGYWKDQDSNHWKIKAWTDGKYIGVLYAYTQNELPEAKINIFLDGFSFKGS